MGLVLFLIQTKSLIYHVVSEIKQDGCDELKYVPLKFICSALILVPQAK